MVPNQVETIFPVSYEAEGNTAFLKEIVTLTYRFRVRITIVLSTKHLENSRYASLALQTSNLPIPRSYNMSNDLMCSRPRYALERKIHGSKWMVCE